MFPRLHGPEAGCFQPTPVITEGHLKDSALGANINSLMEPGPCWQDVAAVPWPQAPVPAGRPLTYQALESTQAPWRNGWRFLTAAACGSLERQPLRVHYFPGLAPEAWPSSEPGSPGLTPPGTVEASPLVFSRQENFASLLPQCGWTTQSA